jgi:hypothetical protein
MSFLESISLVNGEWWTAPGTPGRGTKTKRAPEEARYESSSLAVYVLRGSGVRISGYVSSAAS